MGIQAGLDSSHMWVELHYEFMDAKRYPPPFLDTAFNQLFTKKYQNVCFDAIVVADNIAFEYALSQRQKQQDTTPLLFLGINNYSDSMIQGHTNITGIAEDSDFPGTLDLVQALHPQLERLYLITDPSETGWHMRHIAEKRLAHDQRWKDIRWLQNETYASLMDSLSIPDPQAAVIVLTHSIDRDGTLFSERKVFRMMAEHTQKPIYVLIGHQAIEGIVGGSLLSGKEHGRIAWPMLRSILEGVPADSIPIIRESPKLRLVNYPSLIRFGIDPRLIPEGTQIAQIPYSAWNTYRKEIITVLIVGGVLVGCILVLLYLRMQLRNSRQEYEALVNHVNSVILRLDHRGRILFINHFGEQLFGYSSNELIGRSVSGTLIENKMALDSPKPLIDLILENPNAYLESENENVTRDGRMLWIHWYNRPVFNPDGSLNSIFSVGNDVTEKHLRDLDIARFNQKVAHDLRSPLVTIESFSSELAQDLEANDKESVWQDLDYIRKATTKMNQQVEELSHLFRTGITRQKPSRFPLREAIEEARDLVAGRLQEHQIVVSIDVEGWLTAERGRFVDVMQNLIDNAAKHMGNQKQPRILIGSLIQAEGPALFVQDNGEGIASEHLDIIFNAYVKLDTQTSGSGLGLSLVRRMVESHGGKIWAESPGLGQGSTFWLTLQQLEFTRSS